MPIQPQSAFLHGAATIAAETRWVAAGSFTNRMYVIINQTGGARTISSYQDLSTATQTSIANSTSLWLVSDGTNWIQIK